MLIALLLLMFRSVVNGGLVDLLFLVGATMCGCCCNLFR
jgi:hypothetical protein